MFLFLYFDYTFVHVCNYFLLSTDDTMGWCIFHICFTSVFYRQYICLCLLYAMASFVQVFFVVRTHASNACISWTLAFMCKYFLSSVYMLLMHVF